MTDIFPETLLNPVQQPATYHHPAMAVGERTAHCCPSAKGKGTSNKNTTLKESSEKSLGLCSALPLLVVFLQSCLVGLSKKHFYDSCCKAWAQGGKSESGYGELVRSCRLFFLDSTHQGLLFIAA